MQDEQSTQYAGRGIRVVIVEDERDTRMTLGILLRSEEFDVRMVDRPAEVAEVVREFRPHAVLLDIGLPQRDGYQLAGDLRSEHGSACPRLIAVTAYGSEADKARAAQSGFHHHVTKPYDPARLLELLATLRAADAQAADQQLP